MASDWKPGRLRDIADVVMGQSPIADYVNEACQGKPLLNGPTEFGSMHPTPVQFTTDVRKKANPGDLLFCVRGSTTGRMNWADQEYAIGRGLAAIRHRDGDAFQNFVRAVIELKLPELLAAATGSTFPNVGRDQLLDIPVSIPPKGEQKVISRFFKGIDDKIEINRRINQTLEAMAQAIFKSWFVDFEPVKAKIAAVTEGRDPLRAAMSAISGKLDAELDAELDALQPEQYEQLAATAALFPDEMVESALGEIPKGWNINQINQFGDVVCGKTPSKTNPEYFGGCIPFIKIPDMHNSVYVVSPSERLSASGAASQVKKNIPPGSICVSCIATVGKVVITHELSQTNQQINSIVPRLPQYTTFLYFQMKDKEKEFHDLASGGSATLNMNTSTFSKVGVLNPEFDVLEKFSALVAPLFSEILARQRQSALLSETRDTLLPKLLSGELSVNKAMVEADA